MRQYMLPRAKGVNHSQAPAVTNDSHHQDVTRRHAGQHPQLEVGENPRIIKLFELGVGHGIA